MIHVLNARAQVVIRDIGNWHRLVFQRLTEGPPSFKDAVAMRDAVDTLSRLRDSCTRRMREIEQEIAKTAGR